MRGRRLAFGLAAGVMIATSGRAAELQRVEPLTAQTIPLSSSVLATVASRPQRLEVLVLWRGSPGWYLAAGQRAASYGERAGIVEATLSYGGVTLRLAFDAKNGAASLQGSALKLPPGANVLLVDEVDSNAGPRMVEALALADAGPVDPRTGTLAPFLKRSPALVAFLRCGAANAARNDHLRRIVCDDLEQP